MAVCSNHCLILLVNKLCLATIWGGSQVEPMVPQEIVHQRAVELSWCSAGLIQEPGSLPPGPPHLACPDYCLLLMKDTSGQLLYGKIALTCLRHNYRLRRVINAMVVKVSSSEVQ